MNYKGLWILTLVFVPTLSFARGSTITSEAMSVEAREQERTQASSHAYSRSSLLQNVLPKQELLTITNTAMFTSATYGEMTGTTRSRNPSDSEHSVRNVMNFAFKLSESMTLGPSLDFNMKFNGSASGLSLNDPALKFSVSNLPTGLMIAGQELRSEFQMTFEAPVSDTSKSMHSNGAVSATLVPRIRFANSRFSYLGIASAQIMSTDRADTSGTLFPGLFFGALQTSYRFSPKSSTFLMGYGLKPFGPDVSMGIIGMPGFAKLMSSHPVGIMPGALFRVTDSTTISPRLNWFIDQPLDYVTVGLNATLQLI